MKNKTLLMLLFLLTVFSFLLSLDFYNTGIIFYIVLILGGIFALVYTGMTIHTLYKVLNDKNNVLIGVYAFALYGISYFLHLLVYSFNVTLLINLFLIISYMSLYNLILTLIMVFRYWLTNAKVKNILYFYVINLTIAITLILGVRLFDNLLPIANEIVVFMYYSSVILIVVNILVSIIYKIIKPIGK